MIHDKPGLDHPLDATPNLGYRSKVFLKAYDGIKNATGKWKEENKDKLGEEIQFAP